MGVRMDHRAVIFALAKSTLCLELGCGIFIDPLALSPEILCTNAYNM
jgi:hypothetical protein